MKEKIEKKLGCTIEEYMECLMAHDKKYEGKETECRSFPDSLTYEELDFIGEYMDKIEAA